MGRVATERRSGACPCSGLSSTTIVRLNCRRFRRKRLRMIEGSSPRGVIVFAPPDGQSIHARGEHSQRRRARVRPSAPQCASRFYAITLTKVPRPSKVNWEKALAIVPFLIAIPDSFSRTDSGSLLFFLPAPNFHRFGATRQHAETWTICRKIPGIGTLYFV